MSCSRVVGARVVPGEGAGAGAVPSAIEKEGAGVETGDKVVILEGADVTVFSVGTGSNTEDGAGTGTAVSVGEEGVGKFTGVKVVGAVGDREAASVGGPPPQPPSPHKTSTSTTATTAITANDATTMAAIQGFGFCC